jgi:hypothetical protein
VWTNWGQLIGEMMGNDAIARWVADQRVPLESPQYAAFDGFSASVRKRSLDQVWWQKMTMEMTASQRAMP